MRRNVIALLLAFALGLGTLTACGGGEEGEEGEGNAPGLVEPGEGGEGGEGGDD